MSHKIKSLKRIFALLFGTILMISSLATVSADRMELDLDLDPGIMLEKTGVFQDDLQADGYAQPGEKIKYTYTVTNTGNIPLYNISIVDDVLGTITDEDPLLLPAFISNEVEFVVDYLITAADIADGSITNTALATGWYSCWLDFNDMQLNRGIGYDFSDDDWHPGCGCGDDDDDGDCDDDDDGDCDDDDGDCDDDDDGDCDDDDDGDCDDDDDGDCDDDDGDCDDDDGGDCDDDDGDCDDDDGDCDDDDDLGCSISDEATCTVMLMTEPEGDDDDDDDDDEERTSGDPDVDLIKTVNQSSATAPGTFTFTLIIKNIGDTKFSITELTDDSLSPLPANIQELVGMEIPVGGNLTRQYSITHNDVGPYTNTATVKISDVNGKKDSDTESVKVTVNALEVQGALTVFGAEMPQTGDGGPDVFSIGGLIILIASGTSLWLFYKKSTKSNS